MAAGCTLVVSVCALAFTSVSAANAPSGVGCQPTDGKVYGLGDPTQLNIQQLWWDQFNQDICGNTVESPVDAAGDDMGNYQPSTDGGIPSGGLDTALECRTIDYAATDAPYTEAELSLLDGPACPPQYGQLTNQAAPIMSYPVAGYAVPIEINLTAADCDGTLPTIDLTGRQLSAIMGGSIQNWDDPSLVANNPGLASCDEPITRFVDGSGSTDLLKQYLIDVDNTRAGALCQTGATWQSYYGTGTGQGSSSASYPFMDPSWPSGPNCSEVLDNQNAYGYGQGSQYLSGVLAYTPGGIGYADLSEVDSPQVDPSPFQGLAQAQMENGAGSTYMPPQTGSSADCDLTTISEPGNGASKAMVGLESSDNWASDNNTANGTGDHDDAADLGSAYPICGLSFDLVYSGLSAGPTSPSAIGSLTADQRRTLYSYMSMVLSTLGQTTLANNSYASLPPTWLAAIVQGFQRSY